MQQITAIFSVFMVCFYLGGGTYLVFYFDKSLIDKPVRVLIGSAFLFYGVYRAYRAYLSIVDAFFTHENKRDRNYK